MREQQLEQRITIHLKLPLRIVAKLNAIADKRGDTFREAALIAFMDKYADIYLESLPEFQEDEDDDYKYDDN
jgi:hypothetical protein